MLPDGFTPPSGWTVRFDPDHPLRGQTFTAEREIVLREWHPEVFLHECLHVLLREGRFHVSAPYENDAEEALVQWLSKGLGVIGFCAVLAAPVTPPETDGPVLCADGTVDIEAEVYLAGGALVAPLSDEDGNPYPSAAPSAGAPTVADPAAGRLDEED